eukprot:15365633-Ditylum_brightwellii.AAC.2
MDLAKRLKSSQESKRLWLESVRIAVHDFTVIHKQTPSQWVITDFFQHINSLQQQQQQHQQQEPSQQQQHNWQDADTCHIPALI